MPLVLFAIRYVKQKSVGFSPAELVFGRHVCGPLKVLNEQFLSIHRLLLASVISWLSVKKRCSTCPCWPRHLSPVVSIV